MDDNTGILQYTSGSIYLGDIINNKREGKGTMHYSNGDRYEGDFKNDKPNGKGIYYYKYGHKYEGDIKNTLAEGKGIMYYASGNRYEGDFKNDKPNGKGIYYFKDGNKYKGDIKDGSLEGKGIIHFSDGNSYEIEFKKNESNEYIINFGKESKNEENINETINNLLKKEEKFPNKDKIKNEEQIRNMNFNIFNKDEDLSKIKATNIVKKLFGLNISITTEVFEKTFYQPLCKIKISYSISKSFKSSSFSEEKEIEVINGEFNEFEPKKIINKGGINLDLIGNINTIFKTISLEIGNGKISFSVDGDTFIIEVEFDKHNLKIEITPNKTPLKSEMTKIEAATSSNKWKKLLNFGHLVLYTITIFNLPLVKFLI